MLAIAGQTAGPNSGTLGVTKAKKILLKIRNLFSSRVNARYFSEYMLYLELSVQRVPFIPPFLLTEKRGVVDIVGSGMGMCTVQVQGKFHSPSEEKKINEKLTGGEKS